MLPQAHRLRHEKDIKTLFARGKSVFGDDVGLKFRKNTEDVSRFAVSVGVKVSKRAVDRNRLKRQLREIVRQHIQELSPGYDVMIIGRASALGKKTSVLEEQLMGLFKKTPLCATSSSG